MKKNEKVSGKDIVIVESPTKARTITKILGGAFEVVSSMGHILDLPQKKLGVDIEHGFTPEYEVIKGRQKVLTDIRKQIKTARTVYVATDPDREGEAIGWQVKERVVRNGKKKADQTIVRVVFHEITPSAIKEAFKHPREFDLNMVEAQAGRRVLDRIVGYFLSPLLWRKIGRGLSAGRVQSVALKIIVDRERAIAGFLPQEYWDIEADFHKKERKGSAFTAKLDKIGAEKAQIKTQGDAAALADDIRTREYRVSEVRESEKRRNPDAPFTTSTLQQEAFNKLRYNASRTMLIAQQLYEGIDVGQETPVGLITYMRTDSTKVAAEAVEEVRRHIRSTFGADYLPETPNTFKVKKLAQEAHEAIRPTLVNRDPASLQQFLTQEQYKLYELIYNRFVASQMTPARYKATSVVIEGAPYFFTASGSELIFSGCLAAYGRTEDEEQEKHEGRRSRKIPALIDGEVLNLIKVSPEQHYTKPPARYSDSSLVKALEEEGIGRPSTYAPIIGTLLARDYVRRIRGYFHASELGCKVCDMLVEYFPAIMDVKFTADLEDKLDDIEEGKLDKVKILTEFYHPFKVSLDYAQTTIKKEVVTTDQVCDLCGKPLVVKWGRRGKFLSCSAFPACKFSKSITTDVPCPLEGCGGKLIERRSRRGIFYGCSQYPKCTFTSRNLPEPGSSGTTPLTPPAEESSGE